MKKRIVTIALVVALMATCFAGTYAYLMDTEAAKNVMTVGNVDILQNEYQRNEAGEPVVPFENGKTLLPMGSDPAWADAKVTLNGYTFSMFADENALDKIVTVTNKGNTDAYVRTIVALEAGKSTDEADELWNDYVALTDGIGTHGVCEDNSLYVNINGTYYIIVVYTYNEALAPNEESCPSMTGVALYAAATNEVLKTFDGSYEVLVLSQAVLASAMGEDAGAALDKAFGDVDAANVAEWFKDVA